MSLLESFAERGDAGAFFIGIAYLEKAFERSGFERPNRGREQENRGQKSNTLLAHLDAGIADRYTVQATPGRWIASRQIFAELGRI